MRDRIHRLEILPKSPIVGNGNPCAIAQSMKREVRSVASMKSGRAFPEKSERVPKPIAPNPWRRGRRRSGVHSNGATHGLQSPAPVSSAAREPTDGGGAVGSNGANSGNGANGGIGATGRNGASNGNGANSGYDSNRGNGTNGAKPATPRVLAPGCTVGTGGNGRMGTLGSDGRGHVLGLFADRASAELACRALADRGYREDAMKLLISDETCARHFSDRAAPSGAADSAPRHAVFSHRPKPCPAKLDVAICTDPGRSANGTLAQALAGSGLSDQRVAEYEAALRNGAVLLSVTTRTPDDARLIEIEWRGSYRAEKVQS